MGRYKKSVLSSVWTRGTIFLDLAYVAVNLHMILNQKLSKVKKKGIKRGGEVTSIVGVSYLNSANCFAVFF